MIETAGELSLALRSIAENDGKSLADGGPKLADKYNSKQGSTGGERIFVRYGVETINSSR